MQPKTETESMKLQQYINDQQWHHSKRKGPHEYFMFWDNPKLFGLLRAAIRQNPTKRRFQDRPFTYFIFNGYRYWQVAGVMNRAKEEPKNE